MMQTSNTPPLQNIWHTLNTRQQDYLKAIFDADQEVEAHEKASWTFGTQRRPAAEWRWMTYATLDGHDTPVKRHLRATKKISEGTGATLEALERRGLIAVRYDITTYNGMPILSDRPIPTIQITKAGRALVRKALGVHAPRSVVGTLQEWHWRALARAYQAGSKGLREEGAARYGQIGWNTWVRLRDYTIQGKEYPLIESGNGIHITLWGIGFYERTFERYHDRYPNVSAIAPKESHDPQESYVEIVQGSRACEACLGEYLVEITRTYQQNRTGIWSVSEQDRRLEGKVIGRHGDIEQCVCREGEIQELIAPFSTLLDWCIAHHWHIHFPFHPWYSSLSYVMGVASSREKQWYDPTQVQATLAPLVDDITLSEERNVMRGEMRFVYTERIGKGSIFPQTASGNGRPVALTMRIQP